MTYRTIQVHPISGALGAEISGVDLSRDLDDAVIGEIRRALVENCVIFFRDQHLTPDQHLAFGRRFGDLQIHDFVEGMADNEEILEVRKEEHETAQFRRRLAHRCQLSRKAGAGLGALRPRGAGLWRRHDVCQSIPCLRNLVGWHEVDVLGEMRAMHSARKSYGLYARAPSPTRSNPR